MAIFKKSLVLLNTFSRYTHVRKIANSTVVLNSALPAQEVQHKASVKVEQLADTIAQLNLLEVAELTELLKKKLNLPDTPMMGFSMPCDGAKVDEKAPEVQTSFTVKLKGFDEKQKVALIKEIKGRLEGMNLVQAKKFVESAPVMVKDNIGKKEAEELRDALAKVGADVEIV